MDCGGLRHTQTALFYTTFIGTFKILSIVYTLIIPFSLNVILTFHFATFYTYGSDYNAFTSKDNRSKLVHCQW